jgi:hypothetical protein
MQNLEGIYVKGGEGSNDEIEINWRLTNWEKERYANLKCKFVDLSGNDPTKIYDDDFTPET